MADRMTDERLSVHVTRVEALKGMGPFQETITDALIVHLGEAVADLVAERARVVRLEAALTDLIDIIDDVSMTDRSWEPCVLAERQRAAAVLAEGATT